MILAPPLCGVVLGLIQLAGYRLAVATKVIKPEAVPSFFILWLRGMIIAVALAAACGIWFQFAQVSTRG